MSGGVPRLRSAAARATRLAAVARGTLAACFATGAGAALGEGLPYWIEPGVTYQGDVEEAGTTWAIEAEFAADGIAELSFPSIDCSGFGVPVEGDIERVVLRQLIVHGQDNCAVDSFVIVTQIAPGHLSLFYSRDRTLSIVYAVAKIRIADR